MNLKRILAAGGALLLSASSWAFACAEHFAGGQPPTITNPAMAKQARTLCYDQFAVLHSGITRTPLWSAEKLSAGQLDQARSMVRQNSFHPETQIPASERAELRDYSRSGYDRGHMSPSGNMPTPRAQQQSFTMANMVPQDSNMNRGLWEGVESAVRTYAKKRGTVYVITGPLFEGNRLLTLNNRVMVPTSLYKVVYDPARQQAGAYVARNTATMDYQVISVAALEARAGLDLLPGVPAKVKASAMSLPAPTPHGYGGAQGKNKGAPSQPDFPHLPSGASLMAHMVRSITNRRY